MPSIRNITRRNKVAAIVEVAPRKNVRVEVVKKKAAAALKNVRVEVAKKKAAAALKDVRAEGATKKAAAALKDARAEVVAKGDVRVATVKVRCDLTVPKLVMGQRIKFSGFSSLSSFGFARATRGL